MEEAVVDDELLNDERVEEEFEESDEGGVSVVVKTKKQRVAHTKEHLAFARDLHRSFLVSCIAHIVRADLLAVPGGHDREMPPLPVESVKPRAKRAKKRRKRQVVEDEDEYEEEEFVEVETTWFSTKKAEKTLKRLYEQWIEETETSEVECFIRLASFVRGVWKQECRICFAPNFVSWKPGNTELDEDATPAYWLELWKDDEKGWQAFMLCEKACERVKTDLSYVFACRNGHVREVAVRYSSKWSRTCNKMRFDEHFVEQTCAAVSSGRKADDLQLRSDVWEKKSKDESAKSEELPGSVSAFKLHPTFVLRRHISKTAAVRPGSESVGEFENENVYLRSDVAALLTREQWLQKHAKEPKQDEKPFKCVDGKKQKKTELFGEWQVQPYDPGEAAEDGTIPKVLCFFNLFLTQNTFKKKTQNDHGNVYLYDAEVMMPRRCVLIDAHPATAALLGVDCARAIVDWEYKVNNNFVC
jgi:hypothetical protein